MIAMTLAEVANAVGGQLDGDADPATVVSAPTAFDSRLALPGGLFACLPGARVDGHDFAGEAIARGAVAVLATRPTGVAAVLVDDVLTALADLARAVATRYTGTVVAITGSAGKTSTKDLLVQILARHGSVIATERSFNNEIGFPTTVLRVQADTEVLVVEMGARGKGHIRDLCQIAHPEIGVVLGVGSAHLGEFGSREQIAVAKQELVEALTVAGTAILNADDRLVVEMAKASAAPVWWFGTGLDADVRAENVRLDEHARACFTLVHDRDTAPIRLQVVGEHHLTNALAAAAVALRIGVPFPVVAHVLGTVHLLSGSRMEVLERGDGVTVINDAFNASPESVVAALRSVAALTSGGRPSIAVLGQMRELGDAATRLHAEIGRTVAGLGIEHLITVGGRDAETMADAAIKAGMPDVVHLVSNDQVLPALAQIMTGRDIVLFKGANSGALFDTAAALAAL